MPITQQHRHGRSLTAVFSSLVVGFVAFAGIAPAAAAPEAYDVSGRVYAAEGAGELEGVLATIWNDAFTEEATTGADGLYVFPAVPDGEYQIDFALDGYTSASVDVTVDGVSVPVPMVTLTPYLEAGTVAISGAPKVGEVLTATTSGWPAGTEFTYQWWAATSRMGGPIDGATSPTYTVPADKIGYTIGVDVVASLRGYVPAEERASLEATVTASKKAPMAAPADLDAYLQANGSTPLSQAAAGLPAGSLDPGVTQTATLEWFSQDSYVDVYVYSTPILVGTFPVVNGAVQVTLTPAILAQLATGSHTLVVTGQSSGAVVSVALAIGLAATGAEVALPVSIASGLVLLGAALVFVRRRGNATV